MVTTIAPFFALLKAARLHRGLGNKINKELSWRWKRRCLCLSQLCSLKGHGNVLAGSQGILGCFLGYIDRVLLSLISVVFWRMFPAWAGFLKKWRTGTDIPSGPTQEIKFNRPKVGWSSSEDNIDYDNHDHHIFLLKIITLSAFHNDYEDCQEDDDRLRSASIYCFIA